MDFVIDFRKRKLFYWNLKMAYHLCFKLNVYEIWIGSWNKETGKQCENCREIAPAGFSTCIDQNLEIRVNNIQVVNENT